MTSKTRLPISHYIILCLGFCFAIFLVFLGMGLIGTVFYFFFLTFIIYFFCFNRNCTVTLNDKNLVINYLIPYRSSVKFARSEIQNIQVEFGEIVFHKFWLTRSEAFEKREDKLLITTQDNFYRFLVSTNNRDLIELIKTFENGV